jgi:hypothetical protein
MPEYFTARQVLAATFEQSRRMDFRVPMGLIVPWVPVEVSITPHQYRALHTMTAQVGVDLGRLGPCIE